MEGGFSCLVDSSENHKFLAHFSFSNPVDLENLSTSHPPEFHFPDLPIDNFNAVEYLTDVLNISNEHAKSILNGDVSSIVHAPTYDIDITYTARYNNGTILSGISKNCPLLISIDQLFNAGRISLSDIPRILKLKFNPDFTASLSHVSARNKRKLKYTENNTLVCTISLIHPESNTNTTFDYYIPKTFKGTVFEYNKALEIDSTNLFLRPLDKGWIVLGLDTSKESGVYNVQLE